MSYDNMWCRYLHPSVFHLLFQSWDGARNGMSRDQLAAFYFILSFSLFILGNNGNGGYPGRMET
jgi:hypothetical protein